MTDTPSQPDEAPDAPENWYAAKVAEIVKDYAGHPLTDDVISEMKRRICRIVTNDGSPQ